MNKPDVTNTPVPPNETQPLRAPDIEQVWLTKEQVARYLNFSQDTIDNMIDRKLIPIYKPIVTGKRAYKILFNRSDLDAWVSQFRVEAAKPAPATEIAA